MRAIFYLKRNGAVIGGCTASVEDDVAAQATETIAYLITDEDWRMVDVDISDPANPVTVPKRLANLEQGVEETPSANE
ncbi:hypothetical protein WSK_2084 [Novosphingobium sp. Rr 2-17]|uniref:hypothetical protein n=1 Tax=Novosphingobium sp. Rr 2-17 TaxID=555793 RepID=UPI0002698BA8|nr:hypothetical protein [Novosphingobium sp. Rr 2-17]EIZ79239.1 hypothetical protein WSK_2084 [Novosphingobium sp. Rr 2-17]